MYNPSLMSSMRSSSSRMIGSVVGCRSFCSSIPVRISHSSLLLNPIRSFQQSLYQQSILSYSSPLSSYHTSYSLSSSPLFPSSIYHSSSHPPSSSIPSFRLFSSSSSSPLSSPSSSSSSSSSPPPPPSSDDEKLKISKRTRVLRGGAYLFGLVVCVLGLSYAAVPLYRLFCRVTGFGGTVSVSPVESAAEKIKKSAENPSNRYITVNFSADVSSGMHWKFLPVQHSIRVRVGEPALAFFQAKNLREKAITGVATYNITPMKAGVYFHKIQCFCFDEQRLRPNEEVDMPVYFFIDPSIESDKRLNNVNQITLSYTFFPVDDDDEETQTSVIKEKIQLKPHP